jgi:uncharacterized protein YdeI (BOF family)
MSKLIIIIVVLLFSGCTVAQQNRMMDDYLEWKKQTGYQSPKIERIYDKTGSRVGTIYK